jgi:hypothetical protein
MGVEKKRCIVVNVYSKCDLVAKRRMWEALVEECNTPFSQHKNFILKQSI